ncbi:TonB family protein [Marinicellulosiphila megalodicopiae]|uniref:energy transducer TonB n=1 Tax=Marinicellulosiphila megalodicopiae TaxID=2724896 RepID=UPI003BB09A6C
MAILVIPKIHEGEQKRNTLSLATVDLIEPVIEEKKKLKEPPPEDPPINQPTPPKITQPQQAPTPKMEMDNLFDFADPLINGLQTGDLAINPINAAPANLGQTPSFSRSAQVIVPVTPVYPMSALKRNITGKVQVDFIIDTNGRAKNIQIIESIPEGIFDRSVLKAVNQTKYQPVIESGEVLQERVTQLFLFGEQ